MVAPVAIEATSAATPTPVTLPSTASSAPAVLPANEASAAAPRLATAATASTGAVKPSGASSAGLPSVPKAAIPTIPNVAIPTVAGLPALPSCVTNLIPTGGTVPDPIQLATTLPSCIISVITANLPMETVQSLIGSVGLPIDLSTCLSSVVRSVPTFAGGDLSRLPQLLSACLPTGQVPGMGSFPGMGSLPGFG